MSYVIAIWSEVGNHHLTGPFDTQEEAEEFLYDNDHIYGDLEMDFVKESAVEIEVETSILEMNGPKELGWNHGMKLWGDHKKEGEPE